ncbi:MAG: metalloregulator ArsR/SmtB family transcription factor [Verrucomicrobia bacterium]|nr:metalloregulator ArsR/SmtB family transcription factor [Verrucomicrobiota bacterium]MBV8640820.1 metalloregulator ArsR/SmtB family transcription factor [Verrucomicrobiota bacterium]
MPSTLNSLRTLSDPTRARLMNLLQAEELSVAEIQEILGMGQSRISTHLAQLKRSGLVQDRRVGKNIYYSWTPAGPIKEPELRSLIRLAVGDMPEAASDRSGLKHVLSKRRNRTREYFNKLAGKFGRSYCPGRSWQGLANLLLTLFPPIDVADLGAGEGTLSQLLAKRARKVIAVDISERMVEVGTQLAKEQGFTNLEYRLGDLEEPPIADSSIDLAVFSQALHHANSPTKAIAAARRVLRPGGRLVILDLLAHSFEQARDLYADLWLGFSEVQLLHLLEQAGFRESEVQIVSREPNSPYFQTVLATGVR